MNLTDEQLLICSNAGATAATAALEGGSTAMFVSNRYNPEYDSEARLAFARAVIETARSFDPPPLEWISVRERRPTVEDADHNGCCYVREGHSPSQSSYYRHHVHHFGRRVTHWLSGKSLEALPVRPEPVPVNLERELFEKSLADAGYAEHEWAFDAESQVYRPRSMHDRWLGWQARAAQP